MSCFSSCRLAQLALGALTFNFQFKKNHQREVLISLPFSICKNFRQMLIWLNLINYQKMSTNGRIALLHFCKEFYRGKRRWTAKNKLERVASIMDHNKWEIGIHTRTHISTTRNLTAIRAYITHPAIRPTQSYTQKRINITTTTKIQKCSHTYTRKGIFILFYYLSICHMLSGIWLDGTIETFGW